MAVKDMEAIPMDDGPTDGTLPLFLSLVKRSCLEEDFSAPTAVWRGAVVVTGLGDATCFCGLRLGEEGVGWPGTGFCHAPIVEPMVPPDVKREEPPV